MYLGALPRVISRVVDSAIHVGHETLVQWCGPEDLKHLAPWDPRLPPGDRNDLGNGSTADRHPETFALRHGGQYAADVISQLALRDLAGLAGAAGPHAPCRLCHDATTVAHKARAAVGSYALAPVYERRPTRQNHRPKT